MMFINTDNQKNTADQFKLKKFLLKFTWILTFLFTLISGMNFITACTSENKVDANTEQTATDAKAAAAKDAFIFSPSWTLTAELFNMGEPIKIASELHYYEDWVGKPTLPADIVDVGFRHQPNPEIFSQLPIYKIIDSSWYVSARSAYGDTPVSSVEFSVTEEVATWDFFVKQTKELAKTINKQEVAEHYITESEQQLSNFGQAFKAKNPNINKIAMLQFQDTNTVRLYAKNSIVHLALNKMGLEQATLGEQNGWGFSTVALTELTKLDADTCVVIIEPHTNILQKQLDNSLIWQRLDYGNSRCISQIPPVWLYGGISSIVNLAEYLKKAEFTGNNKNTKAEFSNKQTLKTNKQVAL